MEKKFVDKHVNNAHLITTGVKMSKEIACGKIVFNTNKAYQLSQAGEPVILVKQDIKPEDVDILKQSQGFLFTSGSTFAYAFLIARTLKKSCMFVSDAEIDYEKNVMRIGSKEYVEGTVMSLDGQTSNEIGNIYLGAIPQVHMMGYNDLLRQDLKKRTEKIYSKVS